MLEQLNIKISAGPNNQTGFAGGSHIFALVKLKVLARVDGCQEPFLAIILRLVICVCSPLCVCRGRSWSAIYFKDTITVNFKSSMNGNLGFKSWIWVCGLLTPWRCALRSSTIVLWTENSLQLCTRTVGVNVVWFSRHKVLKSLVNNCYDSWLETGFIQ